MQGPNTHDSQFPTKVADIDVMMQVAFGQAIHVAEVHAQRSGLETRVERQGDVALQGQGSSYGSYILETIPTQRESGARGRGGFSSPGPLAVCPAGTV